MNCYCIISSEDNRRSWWLLQHWIWFKACFIFLQNTIIIWWYTLLLCKLHAVKMKAFHLPSIKHFEEDTDLPPCSYAKLCGGGKCSSMNEINLTELLRILITNKMLTLYINEIWILLCPEVKDRLKKTIEIKDASYPHSYSLQSIRDMSF